MTCSTAPGGARTPRPAVRAAMDSLRGSGLVAPELPSIVFVAVASSTGFWWGVAAGTACLVGIVVDRRRRALPRRPVVGGLVGFVIAAAIAYGTGVAASGLLSDVAVDAGLAAALALSLAVRRPLLAVFWSVVRRRSLLVDADSVARRGFYLTTGVAALALAVRSLALGAVYLAGEPVAALLTVKVVLGLPVTFVVLAAGYAAGELVPTDPPAEP